MEGDDVTELRTLNPTTSSTEVIELSRVRSAPFYAYANPDGSALVVKPGRFEKVVALCLEPPIMSGRVVEVSVGDGAERTAGATRIGRGGIELSLTWSLGAPRPGGVTCDEKRGRIELLRST